MASILLGRSCSRDLKAKRYPTPADGGGRGGYPADFELLVKTAAGHGRHETPSTLDGDDDDVVPSRGVRLLLKAKAFHVAVRGLQETPGFRFISRQPKRQESTVRKVSYDKLRFVGP